MVVCSVWRFRLRRLVLRTQHRVRHDLLLGGEEKEGRGVAERQRSGQRSQREGGHQCLGHGIGSLRVMDVVVVVRSRSGRGQVEVRSTTMAAAGAAD